LIEKGFLKHVMQVMVHGYERKGNSLAQKVFEGIKIYDQYQLSINSLSLVVFVEEMTYNHVKDKIKILLT